MKTHRHILMGALLVTGWTCCAVAGAAPGVEAPREGRGGKPIATLAERVQRAVALQSQRYGLDEVQQIALRELMTERLAGASELNAQMLAKIREMAPRMREAVGEEKLRLYNENVRPLNDKLGQYMDQTEQLIYDRILNEQQKIQRDQARQQLEAMMMATFEDDTSQGISRRMYTGKGFIEGEWARWLELLDKSIKLDATQQAKAQELLTQAKAAAEEYRRDRKTELAEVVAALEKAHITGDPEAIKTAEARALEFSAPLEKIGKVWRTDVESLLTESQAHILRERRRMPWPLPGAGGRQGPGPSPGGNPPPPGRP